MVKKYGVISDVHQDLRNVPVAIRVLKSLGAEKLLVNGDIGNQQPILKDSQAYIAFILDSIGKSGLESYVQPGSHESLLAYSPVMDYFAGQYKNIVDVTKNQKIEVNGHDLIFLPGSDFLCSGEYQMGNSEELPSGKYVKLKDGLARFDELEVYAAALQRKIVQGAMQYFNMNDLRKLTTHPDKTIVVCHVPRKFDNLETGIDVAEFGEVIEDFYLPNINEKIEKGSVFPIQAAPKLVKMGYPVEIKKENRGNESLRDLYSELGIRKAVSGHFHESSHRANDRLGNHVNENEFVNELFWNSGHFDAGHVGLLTVDGEKVSYQNVQL